MLPAETPAPTSACASSRRRARCRWPAIRRSARTFALADARRHRPGRDALGVRAERRPDAGGARLGRRRAVGGVDGSGPARVPRAGPSRPESVVRRDRRRSRRVDGHRAADRGGVVRRAVLLRAAGDARGGRCLRARLAAPCAHASARSADATSACSSSAPRPGADGAAVYSRMFAPEAGVVEDPATGSATGPLGGVSRAPRRGQPESGAPAHRQRAGREDGPAQPSAHAGRGDVARRHHPRARRRQRGRVGEGTISW